MSRSASSSAVLSGLGNAAALSGKRSAARWRPGLAAVQDAPCHSEIFAPANEGSGVAAALVLATDDWAGKPRGDRDEAEDLRSVLWVQTRAAIRLTGRPYRAGLPLSLRHRIIHVCADSCADALFALEEGVRCRDIAFVIGELVGNSKAVDFTASRRLTLAAERHGVPLYLVRLDAQRDLSSARMRWDVTSASSQSSRWNAHAPGEPVWRAELFRARGHAPGTWLLSEDGNRLCATKPIQADNDTKGGNWATGLGRAASRAAGW